MDDEGGGVWYSFCMKKIIITPAFWRATIGFLLGIFMVFFLLWFLIAEKSFNPTVPKLLEWIGSVFFAPVIGLTILPSVFYYFGEPQDAGNVLIMAFSFILFAAAFLLYPLVLASLLFLSRRPQKRSTIIVLMIGLGIFGAMSHP